MVNPCVSAVRRLFDVTDLVELIAAYDPAILPIPKDEFPKNDVVVNENDIMEEDSDDDF